VWGECDPKTLKPSASWLRRTLSAEAGGRVKMVVIVNPSNPTGG